MLTKEVKTGLFIAAALVILLIGAFAVRDVRSMGPAYIVKAEFNYGNGIKPFSPVRIAGVLAGQVNKVEFVRKTRKVLVYARVKRGIKVPVDSEIFINNLGLLDEKYLEIIPGRSNKYIPEGSVVKGVDSVPLFKITKSLGRAIGEFSQVTEKIKSLAEDKEFYKAVKDITLNLKDISDNFSELLESINSRKGTLGRLVYDDSLYEDIDEFILDVKNHPWKLLYKPKR